MDNPSVIPSPIYRAARCLVIGAVAAALPVLAEAQCAMCGTVGQGANDPLVKGMFASILLMVSMPTSLACAVGGWFAWRHRHGSSDDDAMTALETLTNDQKARRD